MSGLLRHTELSYRGGRVAILFLLFAGFQLTGLAAPAPVVDATQGSAVENLEARLKRVESRLENLGMVELLNQFEQIQVEMQRIVGSLEVANHELQTLKKQQKDMYTDIDRRLRKLEQSTGNPSAASPNVGGVPSTPVPVMPASGVGGVPSNASSTVTQSGQGNPAVSATTDIEENVARSAYERAFNLLKQGRYESAITSFKVFLESYPNASYADNAQYWIGEANYATKNYKVALEEFKKVLDNYPNSPKRADTLLKIGYTYAELGDKNHAIQTLSSITSTYPNTTAARLAQKRIKSLQPSR
jgi:tol-pal system protein YbgF